MSAYMEVEIEAGAVTNAMLQDCGFASEMWLEINECLHMGALLDDAMDIVRSRFDFTEKQKFADSLSMMAQIINDMIEDERGTPSAPKPGGDCA